MSEFDARLTDRVRTRGVLGADDAARLLLPVAESLASIHAVSGSHGAVSPQAVQVDSAGRALLIDRTQVAPDPAFVAPDPSAGLRPHPAAADVWAFAAVLLFVTTGQAPGTAAPGIPGDERRGVGWLGPIIELALVTDPRERPTMADVVDYLRAQVRTEPGPRRRPSGLALAVAGAAVIVALAVLGAALLFSGSGDGDGTKARAEDPTSRTVGSTTSAGEGDDSPEPTTTTSTPPVSAEDLEAFARDYVATASRDPDRGFALLTPDYQRASPRYRSVWSAIENPRILAVTADPRAMSVSYTYRYDLAGGGSRTEDITLRLVRRGDRLLIAGASARRP